MCQTMRVIHAFYVGKRISRSMVAPEPDIVFETSCSVDDVGGLLPAQWPPDAVIENHQLTPALYTAAHFINLPTYLRMYKTDCERATCRTDVDVADLLGRGETFCSRGTGSRGVVRHKTDWGRAHFAAIRVLCPASCSLDRRCCPAGCGGISGASCRRAPRRAAWQPAPCPRNRPSGSP